MKGQLALQRFINTALERGDQRSVHRKPSKRLLSSGTDCTWPKPGVDEILDCESPEPIDCPHRDDGRRQIIRGTMSTS
jgi:hypothetical protein